MTIDPGRLYYYINELENLEEIKNMAYKHLEELKEALKSTINSKRKFEAIRTVRDLFDCLKVRGILTHVRKINLAIQKFVTAEHQWTFYEKFIDILYSRVTRRNVYSMNREDLEQESFELMRLRWLEIGELLEEAAKGKDGRSLTKEQIRGIMRPSNRDSDRFQLIYDFLVGAERPDLARLVTVIEKWPTYN